MTAGGPSKCKTSRGMSHKSRSRRPPKRRSYAPIFAALGDETRLALVARLARGEAHSISQLTAGTRLTRQAVTKHLAVLEAARLVTTVWRGREKLHYLNPVPLHEIYERWIGKYERHRLQALSDLKKGLEEKKKG